MSAGRALVLALVALPMTALAIPSSSVGFADLVVGQGIHRDGVTVYPVTLPGAPKLPEGQHIVTLSDALAEGTLTVRENGHSMEVASLRVHNRGKHPVLVMAGEVVEGGQQNRIITRDLLIEPSDAPVVVQVNCVERGRWDGGHAFAYGGRAELGLRRVVQVRRDQSATWQAVDTINSGKAALLESLGHDGGAMDPSTGTYMASMRSGALERQVAKMTAELSREVAKEGEVVGLVVAVGGQVVGSEIYGFPEIFAEVRDETIAALARDAMTERAYGTWTQAPSVAFASAFLHEALGGQAVDHGSAGVAVHQRVETEDTMSYVLADASGDMLHVASYVR